MWLELSKLDSVLKSGAALSGEMYSGHNPLNLNANDSAGRMDRFALSCDSRVECSLIPEQGTRRRVYPAKLANELPLRRITHKK
jgi:hypothetical protein